MEEKKNILLQLSSVTKRFGSFTAVDHVSFTIEPGTVVGLLGPNGAGKTTLLSMLVGLLPPSEGTITIDGIQLTTISAEVKDAFGFVPDSQEVLGQLTGWEYLEFVRRIYYLSDQQWQAAKEYLALFQMTQKAHHLLETYSHGQRKKIQFIAALLHQPLLLLLDEPFSGLDPEMIALAKRLVRKLCERGVGILLSTHDLLMAEDLCDTVFFMNQGKIIMTGSPTELLSTYAATTLEHAFLKALGLDLYEKELDHVLAYF